MIDSMGNARSLIIVGAQASLTPVLVTKFIRASTSRVVIIAGVDQTNAGANPGRQLQELDAVVTHIKGQGATNLEVRTYQPGNLGELERQIIESFAAGDIDLAITTTTSQYLTHNISGPAEPDFDSLSLAKASQTFTEGLVLLRQLAQSMASQGSGHLVALTDAEILDTCPSAEAASTVGIDAYAQALGETARKHGVRLIRARTSRRNLLQKETTPQDLAIAISDALLKKRRNVVKILV